MRIMMTRIPIIELIAVVFVAVCFCRTAVATGRSNSAASSRERGSSQSSRETASQCPDGDHVQEGRKCYYYHSSPLGWTQAETTCRGQQGLLATFESGTNRARSVLRDVHSQFHTGDSTSLLWIGISRSSDGTYMWTDGETIRREWSQKIVSNDDIQGQGCVAVNMATIASNNRISLQVKNCSDTQLSYLCMVDTENAAWTSWSEWGECSATCGTGRRRRERVCLRANGLATCDVDDTEQESCTLPECVVQDYQWGTWSEWSECSATCGGGRRSRSRRCVDSISGDQDQNQCQGSIDDQRQQCNRQSCTDYQWETWSEWGECSATCGGGRRSRSRQCVDSISGDQDQNQCQGSIGNQRQQCNRQSCTVYAWETWSEWSACSATCGGGQRSRSRLCVDSVSGNQDQNQCQGDGEQREDCNTQNCADYQWETWSEWSACSATCGGGRKSRSRQCVDSISGDQDRNQCLGNGVQREQCNRQICTDFNWEEWSEWSSCSATCGGGRRSRSRLCVDSVSGSQDQNQCQGSNEQREQCNRQNCADFNWEEWSEWSACSANCGGGRRSRSRLCVDSVSGSQDQNQCQGSNEEREQCNTQNCADYQWETWSEWSACSATCGGGRKSRSRQCVDSISGDQDRNQCQGNGVQRQQCNIQICTDFNWEEWSEWSSCSATCGGGRRSRSRLCVDSVSGSQDQNQCQGSNEQREQCNAQTCTDYQWETWTEWSACSATCGGGRRSRSRQCVDSISGDQDQNQCQGNGVQRQQCNRQTCTDFNWEEWSAWSSCSATCGGGRRSRSRLCVDSVSGSQDQNQCQGSNEQREQCNAQTCTDYQWETWTEWSACSATCGGGRKSRSRQCVDSISGDQDQNQCQGNGVQKQQCNRQTCTDFNWEEWSEWSSCSATCGGGRRSRSRLCVDSVSGSQDQNQCPGSNEQREQCNTQTCTDYQWETWSEWSACSATCGGGRRSRSRRCLDSISGDQDRNQCQGIDDQRQQCNRQSCTVLSVSNSAYYAWETWSAWSACSATCGGGRRSRSRQCVDSVSNSQGQNQCQGDDEERQQCNRRNCPESAWEEWEQWSACSKTCGRGVRSRVRTCAQDGVPSNQCHRGRDSVTRRCVAVTKCKGFRNKLEMVEMIRPELDARKAAKLEKWARGTEHMREKIFRAEHLKDFAISGHVSDVYTVSARIVCVRRCMLKNGACGSFNFEYRPQTRGSHACELNSVSRDEAVTNGDVHRRTGFMLYDFSTFVPYVDD